MLSNPPMNPPMNPPITLPMIYQCPTKLNANNSNNLTFQFTLHYNNRRLPLLFGDAQYAGAVVNYQRSTLTPSPPICLIANDPENKVDKLITRPIAVRREGGGYGVIILAADSWKPDKTGNNFTLELPPDVMARVNGIHRVVIQFDVCWKKNSGPFANLAVLGATDNSHDPDDDPHDPIIIMNPTNSQT